MQKMQKFNHSMFGELQILIHNEKEHFPGSDVAKMLGYSNPQKAIRDHCKEDGCTICSVTDSLGREQQKRFINEGNLYRLIVRSHLPEAEKFESWVFDEVIPSIRKQGMYMTNNLAQEITDNPEIIHYLAEQVAKINTSNNEHHEKTNNKLETIDRKIEGEYATPQDIDAIKYAIKIKAEKFLESSGMQITLDMLPESPDIYEQAKMSKRQKDQYNYDLGKMKSRILVKAKKSLGMKGNAPNNHIKRKNVDSAIQIIKDLKQSDAS